MPEGDGQPGKAEQAEKITDQKKKKRKNGKQLHVNMQKPLILLRKWP
jgi:hypothetical protein